MGTGTEIERIDHEPPAALSLVDGPDPRGAIAYARQIASAIAEVLVEGSGYVTIQGRKHITIEGWQTVAAMTGHSVEIAWSRPVEGIEPANGTMAWEARAVVADQHGRQVAAAESMADPHEPKAPWARGGNFAVRSMAQTRAASRAASSRMRYIVTLAGFAGVPAEEMGHGDAPDPKELARARYRIVRELPGVGAERLGDLNPTPETLADDKGFAAVVHGLAFTAGRAAAHEDDEAVEGEVIEGQETIPVAEDKPKGRRKGPDDG